MKSETDVNPSDTQYLHPHLVIVLQQTIWKFEVKQYIEKCLYVQFNLKIAKILTRCKPRIIMTTAQTLILDQLK